MPRARLALVAAQRGREWRRKNGGLYGTTSLCYQNYDPKASYKGPACRFVWTTHALEELAKDDRTTDDVETALMNGRFVLNEQNKYLPSRVVGKNLDGNVIQVVVAVDEIDLVIKVVTTF
jgi:Domain of unknown function (DUF4258)